MKHSGTPATDGNDMGGLSIHDLRRRVHAVRRADFRTMTLGQLQARIELLLDRIPLFVYGLELTGVYRARANLGDALFDHTRDLWYPPAEVVTRQRMNEAGTARFYAANTPHTAVFELRPQVGQRYTVLLARSRWEHSTFAGPFVGLASSLSFDAVSLRRTGDHQRQQLRMRLGNANYKKYVLVDEWLSGRMTMPIEVGREQEYMPTIAFANLMFGAPGVNTIMYPSVTTDRHGINLCMQPDVADELLQPSEAWVFEIEGIDAHPDTHQPMFRTRPLIRTTSISGSGEIVWRPPGEGLGESEMNYFSRGQVRSLAKMPQPIA